ncbi:MAG: hypothetical protein GY926_01405 [bacterium]|nr:hypothetical protein [bacterium]
MQIRFVAALFTLGAVAVAQHQQERWAPTPPAWVQQPRLEAWSQFTRLHGPHRAFWSPSSGTPTEVFGAGVPTRTVVKDLRSAEHEARTFIQRHHRLLGAQDNQWVTQISHEVGPLFVLVFQQHIGGIPVKGGRADVRIHKAGKISMCGAETYRAAPGQTGVPSLSAHEALLIAGAKLDLTALNPQVIALQPPPKRLVYWVDRHASTQQTARLCWEVTIDSFDDERVGRAYVDATSGELHQYESDLTFCSSGHLHVRGFHPGLEVRKTPPASSPTPEPLSARVNTTKRDPSTSMTNVTGLVTGVVSKDNAPGDLTNATTRGNSRQVSSQLSLEKV